jgi:dipeptidyl aminopeptidase/acylaminoacyl peptidase
MSELKGRILNDSRTSDLADIEYMNEELRTLDYSSCIEPPKTLLFRGGIHSPYVIFQRVIRKETIWKDLAQETCLPKECFGRVVSTTFACNGFSHVVHYILPPNHQSGMRHPTIFYVHGGPSSSYDGTFSSVEHLWLQYLSSLGFVAVAVNYRGNKGFGDAYEQAIIGDFGGQHVEDIKQLATQIRQLNCVDPQRMHYFGHSFGSYMGGMLLAQHGQFVQQTFKTMILASGVYDWSKNLWGTDPSSFCSPFDRKTVEKRAGGWLARIHKVIGKTESGYPVFADPALDKELNRRISPIEQKAFAKSTPVLLIHGDKDNQVSCLCSQQLYERFIEEGILADFVIIKDADHGYTGSESSLRFMRTLSSFLRDNKGAL